jgi:hypothetical protein
MSDDSPDDDFFHNDKKSPLKPVRICFGTGSCCFTFITINVEKCDSYHQLTAWCRTQLAFPSAEVRTALEIFEPPVNFKIDHICPLMVGDELMENTVPIHRVFGTTACLIWKHEDCVTSINNAIDHARLLCPEDAPYGLVIWMNRFTGENLTKWFYPFVMEWLECFDTEKAQKFETLMPNKLVNRFSFEVAKLESFNLANAVDSTKLSSPSKEDDLRLPSRPLTQSEFAYLARYFNSCLEFQHRNVHLLSVDDSRLRKSYEFFTKDRLWEFFKLDGVTQVILFETDLEVLRKLGFQCTKNAGQRPLFLMDGTDLYDVLAPGQF